MIKKRGKEQIEQVVRQVVTLKEIEKLRWLYEIMLTKKTNTIWEEFGGINE